MKNCLITGGAVRIGKGIALALAKNGYTVTYTYNHSKAEAERTLHELKTYNSTAAMEKAELTNLPKMYKIIDALFEKYSRLDLLILNASAFFCTPILNTHEKDWNYILDVNLKSTFFIMQHTAKKMISSGKTSRIIVLTDIATELIWSKFTPYVISKIGAEYLVKSFAKEFAPNILVNAIAPGAILPSTIDDKTAEQIHKIPLRRMGNVEDIANAVLFLARADYITGTTIKQMLKSFQQMLKSFRQLANSFRQLALLLC
ncbi:hypothetical protein CHS0354_023873 [Potamilus streckersoni]|uniref:Uncharacterized protein n=1 Tax=Potamilus streckersoni TaxID=2493646 RepID=A0AAE0VLT8_9BIVA|nr:hypothetical protein CHS0354_023873 [Potamilus streckersoni]